VSPPSATPLDQQRFAVVDVETTGLSAKRHRVVQIAVVTVLADGTVSDRWSTNLHPWRWHPDRAKAIHGLGRADLKGSPRFADVAPELVRRLDGAVLVAHNAGFDWAFLRRELRRAGYGAPDATRLCTLKLSRSLDPQRLVSHRLPDVAARYGVPVGQQHDALADATATAAVLPHLLRASEAPTLDDLRPIVRGTTSTWPPYTARSWRHRLRRRHSDVAAPAR
jgi:DNA polymerase-3 subunit epsilon